MTEQVRPNRHQRRAENSSDGRRMQFARREAMLWVAEWLMQLPEGPPELRVRPHETARYLAARLKGMVTGHRQKDEIDAIRKEQAEDEESSPPPVHPSLRLVTP